MSVWVSVFDAFNSNHIALCTLADLSTDMSVDKLFVGPTCMIDLSVRFSTNRQSEQRMDLYSHRAL